MRRRLFTLGLLLVAATLVGCGGGEAETDAAGPDAKSEPSAIAATGQGDTTTPASPTTTVKEEGGASADATDTANRFLEQDLRAFLESELGVSLEPFQASAGSVNDVPGKGEVTTFIFVYGLTGDMKRSEDVVEAALREFVGSHGGTPELVRSTQGSTSVIFTGLTRDGWVADGAIAVGPRDVGGTLNFTRSSSQEAPSPQSTSPPAAAPAISPSSPSTGAGVTTDAIDRVMRPALQNALGVDLRLLTSVRSGPGFGTVVYQMKDDPDSATKIQEALTQMLESMDADIVGTTNISGVLTIVFEGLEVSDIIGAGLVIVREDTVNVTIGPSQ